MDARRVVSRTWLGSLVAYGVFRAAVWLMDWPHVLDLVTKADHSIYMGQAQRVLTGGPLYPAWELAGPFVPAQLPELYPPFTVYGLLVPMSLLPDVLWWAIPLTVIAAVVAWHRPNVWGWCVIGTLFLAWPSTWVVIAAGNPALWVTAGVGLATVRAPFALAALVKPTLAPFALVGVRSRWWWAGLAAYGVAMLVTLPAWLDYARVLANYRTVPSLIDAPLVAIPLVAWWSRGRA